MKCFAVFALFLAVASINSADAITVNDAVASLCPAIADKITSDRSILKTVLSLVGTEDIGDLPAGHLVVLAPSDDAFMAVLSQLGGDITQLTSNPKNMTDLISIHIGVAENNKSKSITTLSNNVINFNYPLDDAADIESGKDVATIADTMQNIKVESAEYCGNQTLLLIDSVGIPTAAAASLLGGDAGPGPASGPSIASVVAPTLVPALAPIVQDIADELINIAPVADAVIAPAPVASAATHAVVGVGAMLAGVLAIIA